MASHAGLPPPHLSLQSLAVLQKEIVLSTEDSRDSDK